jgi:riboflavin kinase
VLRAHVANLPDESLPPMSNVAETGVYYGYAQVSNSGDGETLCTDDSKVWPMVMSLGMNPFYGNERMTAVRGLSHPIQQTVYTYIAGNPCHARVQIRLLWPRA